MLINPPNIRINQKAVHLAVNILNRDLESIKASGFGDLKVKIKMDNFRFESMNRSAPILESSA